METLVILVNICLTESTVCSIQQPKLSKICLLWLPVNQNSNGTDDSLLRALHGGGSPPGGTLAVQPSSIPMLSSCFNKLFSMLQVHHVQVRTSSFHFCITNGLRVNGQFFFLIPLLWDVAHISWKLVKTVDWFFLCSWRHFSSFSWSPCCSCG